MIEPIIHIFKEYYGVTPKKYYDNLRLEEARKKLINTQDTIVDIAYSVGFLSLSAFYAFFQKALPAIWWKRGKSGKLGAWKHQQADFMRT
jgi:methylphosphotriester-DNA--protein-cysteine methyltransferase